MSRAIEIVQAARDGRYAIGAFNAINLETAQAIVWAAEAENSPVILQISQNAARYAGLEEISAIGKSLRSRSKVPIILHYDHAETLDNAQQALELGYDSVMLESNNIAEIQELVRVARRFKAAVEAEYEVVEKSQRAAVHNQADLARFEKQLADRPPDERLSSSKNCSAASTSRVSPPAATAVQRASSTCASAIA